MAVAVTEVARMASRETSCHVATVDPEATAAGLALRPTKMMMASQSRRATRSPGATKGETAVAQEVVATGATDPGAKDAVATGAEGVTPEAPKVA